jgi:hypothetical protein
MEDNKIQSAYSDICDIIDTLQKRANDFEGIACTLEKYHETDADLIAAVKERLQRAKIEIRAFQKTLYVLDKYQ